jgi:hypothetical protein
VALALAACGPSEPDTDAPEPGDPIETEDPDPPTEPEDGADDPDDLDDADDVDDPDDADDHDADDPDDEAAGDDAVEGEDVERLPGEATTDDTELNVETFGQLAVVDVRVATHDGFDRVVFEVDGDGDVGAWLRYAPDGVATSQGSGEPIETEGEAALEVAVHGVGLPPDLPEGLEPREDDTVPGPDDGVITEIVDDTIFEGIHLFAVGVDEERGYVVEILDDPQRVVVDIVHD